MLPDGSIANLESSQYTKQVDIFAFGLCTLELATRRELDAGNCAIWPQLLALVPDEDARSFIYRCAPEQLYQATCLSCCSFGLQGYSE